MSRKQVVADCWYRGCLWLYLFVPLTWLYGLLSALRRYAYRRGWLNSTRLSVPVIVVGNITVGGTGKTPFVLWLVDMLRQAGWHPGIVSRGYGGRVTGPAAVSPEADAGDYGDEPLLLARRAGCPVWIGRRRAEAGQALLAAHPEVNVLVADDGLQHYALERTAEIVLIDGARGLGNGWRLPVGPLREARGRLSEVDAVVVNGVVTPRTEAQLGPIEPAWMHLHGGVIYNLRQPDYCVDAAYFAGRPVRALAGIGHPERFFASLDAMGIDAEPLTFADHHDYVPGDLPPGTLLMTEKDAVKCAAFQRDDMWALRVDAQVSDGLQTIILDKLKKTHGQQTA